MRIHKPAILRKRGAAWLAFLGPFFFLSYGLLNHFTSGRNDIGVVVEAWERNIPFVPWLMLPYMSIDVFYAVSFFIFRQRSALDRHAKRLLLATIISLLGFLLYPLQFSFEVPKADGFNGLLQAMLLGFDKPYNQAPSLHISLLIVLWVCYAKKLTGWARLALHGWFFAIGASVLLVYQHHFIDVWTGALAGLACLYLLPDAPFWWRWKAPTSRMKYIALRYAFCTACASLAAFFASEVSGILEAMLIWLAVSLGLVVAVYLGYGQQIFQRDVLKQSPLKQSQVKQSQVTMRWPAKLLLAPYLFLSWLSYRMYTINKSLPNQIQGNVWLGAFPRQAVCNMGVDWAAVLDLTSEFPVATLKAPIQKYLPVIDLTPPKPQTLVRAVRWLERAQGQGNVLVHCALGLSRSASVVVCWLVWRGHADNVQSAVKLVNAKRPGLVLSAEHLENISLALKRLKQ